MNHQPFRDWLLSDRALSTDQSQLLQDHLQTCGACREVEVAWTEVESAIHKTRQVMPNPGFTSRWQSHLAEYQDRIQKRKGWISIGIIIPIVVLLLGVSAAQIWRLVQAPGPYLAAWFTRIVDLLSIYFSIQNFLNPVHWDLPIYTFIAMFFLTGFISFMSVLWLTAYRKFSMARRII